MKVLVTGATGRIGTHVTRGLLEAGHSVRVVVMPGDPRIASIPSADVDVRDARLQDTEALRDAVTGVDAVFHLAAALPSRGSSDSDFFDINLRGTFDLLCAVRDLAPNLVRFVYASSDTVYSDNPDAPNAAITELTPKRPVTIYGASKSAAEELCMTFWRGYALPVTILRFGGTYDAYELITPGSVFARQLFTADLIARIESFDRPSTEQTASLEILRALHDGNPRQLFIHADEQGVPEIRHWGDARDIATGCLLTLGNRLADGEIFGLAGPSSFSAAELVLYISQTTGDPFVEARLPWSSPPLRFDLAKARTILGYDPQFSVFASVADAWNEMNRS